MPRPLRRSVETDAVKKSADATGPSVVDLAVKYAVPGIPSPGNTIYANHPGSPATTYTGSSSTKPLAYFGPNVVVHRSDVCKQRYNVEKETVAVVLKGFQSRRDIPYCPLGYFEDTRRLKEVNDMTFAEVNRVQQNYGSNHQQNASKKDKGFLKQGADQLLGASGIGKRQDGHHERPNFVIAGGGGGTGVVIGAAAVAGGNLAGSGLPGGGLAGMPDFDSTQYEIPANLNDLRDADLDYDEAKIETISKSPRKKKLVTGSAVLEEFVSEATTRLNFVRTYKSGLDFKPGRNLQEVGPSGGAPSPHGEAGVQRGGSGKDGPKKPGRDYVAKALQNSNAGSGTRYGIQKPVKTCVGEQQKQGIRVPNLPDAQSQQQVQQGLKDGQGLKGGPAGAGTDGQPLGAGPAGPCFPPSIFVYGLHYNSLEQEHLKAHFVVRKSVDQQATEDKEKGAKEKEIETAEGFMELSKKETRVKIDKAKFEKAKATHVQFSNLDERKWTKKEENCPSREFQLPQKHKPTVYISGVQAKPKALPVHLPTLESFAGGVSSDQKSSAPDQRRKETEKKENEKKENRKEDWRRRLRRRLEKVEKEVHKDFRERGLEGVKLVDPKLGIQRQINLHIDDTFLSALEEEEAAIVAEEIKTLERELAKELQEILQRDKETKEHHAALKRKEQAAREAKEAKEKEEKEKKDPNYGYGRDKEKDKHHEGKDNHAKDAKDQTKDVKAKDGKDAKPKDATAVVDRDSADSEKVEPGGSNVQFKKDGIVVSIMRPDLVKHTEIETAQKAERDIWAADTNSKKKAQSIKVRKDKDKKETKLAEVRKAKNEVQKSEGQKTSSVLGGPDSPRSKKKRKQATQTGSRAKKKKYAKSGVGRRTKMLMQRYGIKKEDDQMGATGMSSTGSGDKEGERKGVLDQSNLNQSTRFGSPRNGTAGKKMQFPSIAQQTAKFNGTLRAFGEMKEDLRQNLQEVLYSQDSTRLQTSIRKGKLLQIENLYSFETVGKNLRIASELEFLSGFHRPEAKSQVALYRELLQMVSTKATALKAAVAAQAAGKSAEEKKDADGAAKDNAAKDKKDDGAGQTKAGQFPESIRYVLTCLKNILESGNIIDRRLLIQILSQLETDEFSIKPPVLAQIICRLFVHGISDVNSSDLTNWFIQERGEVPMTIQRYLSGDAFDDEEQGEAG